MGWEDDGTSRTSSPADSFATEVSPGISTDGPGTSDASEKFRSGWTDETDGCDSTHSEPDDCDSPSPAIFLVVVTDSVELVVGIVALFVVRWVRSEAAGWLEDSFSSSEIRIGEATLLSCTV